MPRNGRRDPDPAPATLSRLFRHTAKPVGNRLRERVPAVQGWILGAIGLAAAAAGAFWIRSHGFSARETPAFYETFLARHVRRLASEPGAKALQNPIEATPLAIAEARDHFADHCAVCHGNRGDGKTAVNAGLYPPAPDMRTSVTQDLSDGELFYIVKNGVRFTGMPGWGGSDEENWKLVLFIRHLPRLTDKEVEFMTEINRMEAR